MKSNMGDANAPFLEESLTKSDFEQDSSSSLHLTQDVEIGSGDTDEPVPDVESVCNVRVKNTLAPLWRQYADVVKTSGSAAEDGISTFISDEAAFTQCPFLLCT